MAMAICNRSGIFMIMVVCLIYLSRSVEALRCVKCQDVYRPNDCNKFENCLQGEVCYVEKYIEFNTNKFRFGCLPKKACSSVMNGKLVGKRSERDVSGLAVSVYNCCNNDLCNDLKNETTTPGVSTTKSSTVGKPSTSPTTASIVANDTIGKEFVVMIPMDNYYSRNIETVITATENGEVTICIPANGTCYNNTITKGNNVFKFLAKGKAELEKMTIQEKAVTVSATVDVSLIMVLLADNTGYDSYYDTLYLALPVEMLSTEYITSSHSTYYNASYSYSYVAVAAVADDTEVNFTLNIGEGFVSKIPYQSQYYTTGDLISVQLQKYETFQVGGSADFTGTSVKSSKPVAVLSGAFHTNIISHDDEDFISQMIPPNECLKTKFIIPPFMSRTGFVFRVISPDNNATITINNNETFQFYPNASFYEYKSNSTEPVTVSSDQPVLTVLYAQSGFGIYNHSLSFNYGGGNMIIVPAISQYLSDYSFSVPSVPKYVYIRNESYVSVISETSVTGSIQVGKNSISDENPDKYAIMLGKTSYDIRSFKIKPGFHRIYSNTGGVFGLINYGFKWATGYGSPMYLRC